VPLLAVLLALSWAEWWASHSVQALSLDALLFSLFVLLAPASYRALSAYGTFGTLLYVLAGSAVVLAFGALVGALRMQWTYVIDPGSLGVLVVLFLVGGWGLGRDLMLEERAEERTLAAERLALEVERNALLALRAQLDPHFLFNTLNAIAEWCRDDPGVAERATLKLAGMLRSMLEGVRRSTWPLEEELALLRALTELYEIRDRGRYRFRLELPERSQDVEVPPMLLLPLIENAITHGPSAGHEGEVSVLVRLDGDRVLITLDNPGAFGGRREGGHGLSMVEKRIELAYRGRASLTVRAEGARTHTALSLPERPEERA
jgi:two-component system sensor histidine kinase AlgZ